MIVEVERILKGIKNLFPAVWLLMVYPFVILARSPPTSVVPVKIVPAATEVGM
jgi:hypothetical protein